MLQLAFVANLGYNIETFSCITAYEISKQIKQAFDELRKTTQNAINYKLVWGPYVYKVPFLAHFRDNTLYIAQNQNDPSQYVLAIAGTNPCEIWDWLLQDFLVNNMIHWQYGNAPAEAKISTSAAFSLSIAQNAHPCFSVPSRGKTLKQFLGEKASEGPIKVVVTGHSLGGEMTTTVALWLADTQGSQAKKDDEWDPDNHVTISAYGFAGPTAGNAEWAHYFDRRLGARTCRIWNSKDVVPHAWNLLTMAQIPNLYASAGINMPIDQQVLLKVIELGLAKNAYTQIHELQSPLKGQVDPSKGDTFATQAAYQHMEAYFDLLGVPHTTNPIKCS